MALWRWAADTVQCNNPLDYFSVCGRLMGHFLVCCWLCVVTAFIKQRANVTDGLDHKVWDPTPEPNVFARVAQTDRSQDDWCVDGQDITIWVDMTSLATGVITESGGAVVEDVSWQQLMIKDKHINLAVAGHQPLTAEDKGDSPEVRLNVHALLGLRYIVWKVKSMNEGYYPNAGQMLAQDTSTTGLRIWVEERHGTG